MHNLETLITQVYNWSQVSESFFDSIPNSISLAFFDNPMTNASNMLIEDLLEYHLGDRLYQEVMYFLYDYREGFTHADKYSSLELFITYLKKEFPDEFF